MTELDESQMRVFDAFVRASNQNPQGSGSATLAMLTKTLGGSRSEVLQALNALEAAGLVKTVRKDSRWRLTRDRGWDVAGARGLMLSDAEIARRVEFAGRHLLAAALTCGVEASCADEALPPGFDRSADTIDAMLAHAQLAFETLLTLAGEDGPYTVRPAEALEVMAEEETDAAELEGADRAG